MSRSRNYDREYTQIERLKKENAELKRDYAKLRKVVDRLNLDLREFQNLRELVGKQAKEVLNPKKAKRDWTCFECGKGTMSLHIMTRRDGTFYYRKCTLPECDHRTKLKRYNDEVEES